MFGSSRLGTENTQYELIGALPAPNPYTRTLGLKYFELSNHLGNVLSVVTDRKIPIEKGVIYSNDFSSTYSPPFTFSTGSVTSINNGRLQVTVQTLYAAAAIYNLPTIAGHNYKITVDIDPASGGQMALFANDVATNTYYAVNTITTSGTYINQFTAIGTLTNINFENSENAARTFYIDNMLIEDLTANPTPAIDYFQPEVIASNDYTPFGAPMDGRTFNTAITPVATIYQSVFLSGSNGWVNNWGPASNTTISTVGGQLQIVANVQSAG
ncbi:MAG: hypothetical protein H0W84_05965, partial [Bacteroidetes bacterium]|nr:hypothetical protein [Bacteroidota bacterium]